MRSVAVEYSMHCTRALATPARARSWIADNVASLLTDDALEAVQLVVSELVTNAIDHAHGEIELHVAVLDGLGVRIEVADGSPDCAVVAIPPARPDQVGGRGLRLVEACSESWGCRAGENRKFVWAVLAN